MGPLKCTYLFTLEKVPTINQSIKPLDFFLKTRTVGRRLCLGGGGGAVPDPKKFSEPHSGKEMLFWPSRGSAGMLPRKMFKIKGPRLAKNAFPDISAWKKLDKNKSARILALKFGRFKKIDCLLCGGGGGATAPCAPASYCPEN